MTKRTVAELLSGFFDENRPLVGGALVIAAYLFGSYARGSEAVGSDVDIAVLLSGEPTPTIDGSGQVLASELSKFLGLEVDLVVLNAAPADLTHRVFRDGVIVFDIDCSARIKFEVLQRNLYFDMLPILKEYRRARKDAA